MTSSTGIDSLVPTFNALPRNRNAPSGMVPNHYHFSIRQVPLTPPGRVVFIILPAARYVHVEGPLPPDDNSASSSVKATTIAILLLKAFNGGLSAGEEIKAAGLQVGRPWSWVCNDAEMAGAVGEVLRGMGVTAPEGVGVAKEEENSIADEEWGRFFGKLQTAVHGR